MQLKLCKCLPYLLILTDVMDIHSNGQANGPVVRIRPAYRDDEGLLQHELIHVRQWWRTLGLHSLLYLCSKKYRLKAEVEAYREQIKWMRLRSDRPSSYYKDLYATWLSLPEPQGYGLQDICTKARAIKLLEA